MKISLSGPLGSNFKWSGKYGLSFTIPDSPSRNLEPFFKIILQIRKLLFSYKIIIILLCNSLWAEGKEANFLHIGAHQNPGVKIIKAVIDISHYLGSDIIPEVCALDWKKYCFYKYFKNGLSNILNQKKNSFFHDMFILIPHQSIMGMKQTWHCSNLYSLLKIHCRWESTGSFNLTLTTFL